jgi:hypothetical protein
MRPVQFVNSGIGVIVCKLGVEQVKLDAGI